MFKHEPTELLAAVAEATILFHSASPWTDDKAAHWARLMELVLGNAAADATTKTLCDAARAAIATLAQALLEQPFSGRPVKPG